MTDKKVSENDLKTLYLHGFLSSGNSYKAQWFKKRNIQNSAHPLGEMFCPTYSQQSLADGLKSIDTTLARWQKQNSRICLIGSSLGGYLVQYYAHKYAIPYIMINPALNPLSLFDDYLGQHTNPYTGEIIEVNEAFFSVLADLQVSQLNPEIPSLLLADKADEVVDIPFALQRYKALPNAKSILFPGGDHTFQHLPEAWEEIKLFIAEQETKTSR
ncbi:YqiA/YcfP family alpha/beta fold hydrolase [Thiomicrorhabdus xiamenensis]|uniref:Esterase n=1 Tax=Thiomicrorhabdus xiamenensis TaxID=2739063 RepID=A0A7D4P4D0_9GAMM|nr:YqiA/YcfP family alpha/beta fold hydrolase [Thiomicrorhabdus xiamenensis]QKI89156.1 hypothetical protein HQN79_06045 [Thiomicrorhabdus xiamenensis]